MPFPVNGTLRFFSCFLLTNDPFEPVTWLRQPLLINPLTSYFLVLNRQLSLYMIRMVSFLGAPLGVLPYISYICMCRPHRVGFLCRFGLKKGIHFAHFGLKSGMVFEGTTGAYKRIHRFNSRWERKKEREICEFEMGFKNFLFALESNEWWHNFCLKARSENGYGF